MSTRHERREQRLKERRKHQQRKVGAKRVTPRWVTPAIVAGVLVLAILGLRQAGVFEPPPPPITPPPTTEKLGTQQPDRGNSHAAAGQRVTYTDHPPTSGAHWDLPHAGWGVKDTPQDDERVAHNLEHGGIAIQYRNLPPEDLANLKTLVRRMNAGPYRKVLLRPYNQMEDGIVLTAWRWSLVLEGYDEDQITRFVNGHYGPAGDAPEPNAT